MSKIYLKKEWQSVILFLFLMSFQNAFSQKITSNIRGIVEDVTSNAPLIGATLQLSENEEIIGATSDDDGKFIFENIAVGRYEIKVSYIGYETKKITNIQAESGKETVLKIQLSETQNDLNEVVVKANANENFSQNYLSQHVITVEESERFPATFYDPARLAASFPGIVNTNDQTNNISIRGNSPANLKWYLEGVEIVNPNHLTTAGMFGDQISLGGGAVNVLSAQMLNTSTILKGAYPASHGNAIGGIMDMRLRAGNNNNKEFTAQAGVLGLDFAAEGPFSKNSEASFLVNYRYSFTGILAAAGVDFGGEEIAFQDLAMTFNFPTKKLGDFKFFGIWGDSRNDFSGIKDPTLRVEDKERFDINYESDILVTGLSHQINLSEKGSWHTTLAYSKSKNQNVKNNLDDTDLGDAFDVNEEEKITVNTFYQFKINTHNQLKIGASGQVWKFDVLNGAIANIPDFSGFFADAEKSSTLYSGYAQYATNFAEVIDLEVITKTSYFSIFEEFVVEPRVNFNVNLPKNQQISISGRVNSQVHSSYVYAFAEDNLAGGIFDALPMTKSLNATMGYRKIFQNLIFSAEYFYQNSTFFGVVLSEEHETITANLSGSIQEVGTILESGRTRSFGLEFNLERPYKNGFFYLINGTLYGAKFRISDERDLQDSPWNGNFAFNATFGKEFQKEKTKKTRVFGLNVHATFAGGMRYKNVDIEASQMAGITRFEKTTAFDNQFSNYFRPDLRLYLKWNKSKYNALLSIDIQNFINKENDGFLGYDFVKNEVVLQKQLGMIPVLNYRIEF